MDTRKIVFFTGTRADWGLLSPVARAVATVPGAEVTVAATNMHLDPARGNTLEEVRRDGFNPVLLPMDYAADTPMAKVAAMGECQTHAAQLLDRLKPDMAVILGDRYEMLAIATACLMMRVPIAHIAGGEISEGAVDDSIRHAITKMSALHLTATEAYRQRVIQMGEDPGLVVNTGAIGVYNIGALTPVPLAELEQYTTLPLDRNTVIVTYHPATLDDADIDLRVGALLTALDAIPEMRVVITAPNNDPAGQRALALMRRYAQERPGRAVLIPSLGRRRYLSALQHVGAVVGNSSSGIVEVPSAGIPTVDIGIRQRGRIAADSVLHCADDAHAITKAIRTALATPRRRVNNPYYRPDTLELMTRAITQTPLSALRTKHFHDL